ncbi:nuclear transport factor 2 family protein [Shewanella surugensis]|uniref:Nuclear transport factor 2 family protein n=1 Tax=Shewanella surugensis TaxID=212020 RepID=A0ABT0LAI1_9GAMM|nr:nuclear transport factor 2 family protein [Shewanella surugensis]MCL1124687.1 nuclear transport factor 2 family protein [Shewanella surugensis]
MSINTLEVWHQLVKKRDPRGLSDLLSEEVVFYSPVLHTPQVGKVVTQHYLSAAFHIFFNAPFRYVREVVDGNDAILEFEVEIDGLNINGVDMIKWNDAGQIVEFKVMLRPLKAVHLIQQKMAEMLKQVANTTA